MEANIVQIRHNPLMERAEATVNLEHEGESTPSEEDVSSRLAAEEDWNEDELDVESIKTGFGSQSSTATVKIYQEIDLDSYEDKVKEKTVEKKDPGSEGGSEGTSYDEVVSGTISEAKEALNGMEDPDYDAALEAEEDNKDRKTLKEWLESQKE